MKKTYQIALAAALVALVAGCSSPKYKNTMGGAAGANGNNSGVETQGISGADQFNGQSSDGGMSTLSSDDQAQVAALSKKVYFAFDSNNLDSAGQSVAQANASFLLKHPSVSVLLAGHTDPRGSQEYNFHLGERRANAVKDYLMQQGVAASQICTVSYGELRPAAQPVNGNWQQAYQMDRRVEIQYGQGCQTGPDAASVASSAAPAAAASTSGSNSAPTAAF